MRDPARIDRVINALRWYWHENPDLRLGQIITNLTPAAFHANVLVSDNDRFELAWKSTIADPFHVEDEVWEKVLTEGLKKS